MCWEKVGYLVGFTSFSSLNSVDVEHFILLESCMLEYFFFFFFNSGEIQLNLIKRTVEKYFLLVRHWQFL